MKLRASAFRRPLLLILLTFLPFTSLSAQVLSGPLDTDGDGVPNVQESHDGTDALSADSFIEHVGTEYCVDWNGFLESDAQIMELRNAGCSTLQLQFALRDAAGATHGTLSRSLGLNQQFDVIANAMTGFAPLNYGTLCATITGGDADTLDARSSGYGISGTSFGRGYSAAAPVARSGPQFIGFNHHFPSLNATEANKLVEGWVQVSSAEATSETGELVYYNGAGAEIKRALITIAARGRYDSDTHSVGQHTVGSIEWRPTNSTKRFRVTVQRYYRSGGAGSSYSGILALPARRPSGATVASAFRTDGRLTVLELTNTLSSGVNVSAAVYTAAGALTAIQPALQYIAPKGTVHLVMNNYLPSGAGKVQFSASRGQSVISELIEYRLDNAQRFAGVSVSEPKAGFGVTQRSSFNSYLGGCSLLLTNLTGATRSATLAATRNDGSSFTLQTPIAVGPHGQTAISPCTADNQNSYGGLVLTPDADEALVAEVIRDNADGSAEIKTTATERSICQAALQLNTPSLSLVAGGSAGTVIVTNTSTAVTATNVHAVLPSGWNDVSVDASACASLAPQQSCAINFLPGLTTHVAASVSVFGDNTTEVLPTVVVGASPTAVITVSGSPLGLTASGATGALTITNTSTTITALNVVSNFGGTALSGLVTESGNTCSSIAPLGSCTLTFTPGNTAVAQTTFTIAGTNTNTVNAAIAISAAATTLSMSVSTLALSVTGYTEFGVAGTPSSGLPRVITVTNVGSDTALNVGVTLPTWPTGTTATTTCGATLAAASSCSITVTPGSTATSDGTNPSTVGTAPIPGTVSVTSDNAATVTTDVVVLGYGSIWQGGHVFAFDDTTSNTGSVGGKVMTTADQAMPFPNGVIWSSNGNGGAAGDVVYDIIYGISETSTTSTPNPNTNQVAGQTACNGAVDGSCNSNNIVTYYQVPTTNPSISLSFYAAGLCEQTISGYSDWYLPAVCEMIYAAGSGNGCGSSGTPVTQNIQSTLVDLSGLNLVAGFYWSSTEFSAVPNNSSWVSLFASGGGALSTDASKDSLVGVRCVRALTL